MSKFFRFLEHLFHFRLAYRSPAEKKRHARIRIMHPYMELYLGFEPEIGFRLNVSERVLSFQLVLFAVYFFNRAKQDDYPYTEKEITFALSVTAQYMLIAYFWTWYKYLSWPWAWIHTYSAKLLPNGLEIPSDFRREDLLRLPNHRWAWDKEIHAPLRVLKWFWSHFIRWAVPTKYKFPKIFYPRSLSNLKGSKKADYVPLFQIAGQEFTFDYTYKLSNGEAQNRIAKVEIAILAGTPAFLLFIPVSLYVNVRLDITFDGEVGEESGSWKGGVTGTSCTIKRGETIEQAFRRFERDRKF